MSGLIAHTGQIWLAVDPVDMRRGMDGLSMIVQQVLGYPPCAGSAFIFYNRAGNRIKVLLWDGTGVWLCQRRLHQGRFVWPKQEEACVELTPSQWEWLTAGVDWRRLSALAQLDQLNLDTTIKQQVADLVQALLRDQTQRTEQAIYAQELKIQALTLELAHLRRIRFGKKNEALSPRQLTLFEESALTDITAIQAEIEQIDSTPKTNTARLPRTRAGRQPLPDHLPRIEHRHEPASCQCDQCGRDLVKISEDITEQLDVEPARFFVHRHIRPQYACKSCETITAEPVPLAVIDGGMAAPGLLAWVLINKYLNHLPLYRLEQIATREQVTLPRSTLAEWVGRTGVALQPLVDRLTWHLLQGKTLHADETPVAQLEPGHGKTRKAYLWAYRSNDLEPGPRIIVFDYQTGLSCRHTQHFLRNWQGHLLVDDYAGYKALFSATTSPCIELGCWGACAAQILRSAPG